ncbi:hypothetical protein PSTG_18460, partial [Puccinia striiformis f. sp. tritici PST-78]
MEYNTSHEENDIRTTAEHEPEERSYAKGRGHTTLQVSPPVVCTSGLYADYKKHLPSATLVSRTPNSDTGPTENDKGSGRKDRENGTDQQGTGETLERGSATLEVSSSTVCTPGPHASRKISLPSATNPTITAAKTSWSTSARISADAKKDAPTKTALELVPNAYHRFIRMFQKTDSKTLPPRRKYDFRVKLIDGATPQASRIIPLSPAENQALAHPPPCLSCSEP